jgi:general nucleoside transport system ATP-binding protein
MDQLLESTSKSTAVIRLSGISKRFGATWANRDISLTVREAEIHALVGENGAGKSTLLKSLFGHLQPDRGEIYLHDHRITFRRPLEALRAGIGMVHQQLLIFPQLTTLENIIVGAEPRLCGWLSRYRARTRVDALCRTFGFDLPLDVPASELPHAHRQQIELVRMLFQGAKILLLDEPTSLLAPPEVTCLLGFLRNLRDQGYTIVFVSHRLEEVFSIADRISVLVDGRLQGTYPARSTSLDRIAREILTGKEVLPPGQPRECLHSDIASTPSPGFAKAGTESADNQMAPVSCLSWTLHSHCSGRHAGPVSGWAPEKEVAVSPRPRDDSQAPGPGRTADPFLALHELGTAPAGHEAPLTNLTFPVIHAGEILGIAGIVGNGLRTLAHALAGFTPLTHGHIELCGREITLLSPKQRIDLGFRWLPANPTEEALMPARSLWENLLLGRQRHPHVQCAGLVRKPTVIRWGMELLDHNDVGYENMLQPLGTLSGGNQQKVAVVRVLVDRPCLVIFEQPTRGLDIRARERLYQVVRSMSAQGTTFVVLSHDLDELLALCHRIAILYRGRLMGMAARDQARREALGRWMLGLE